MVKQTSPLAVAPEKHPQVFSFLAFQLLFDFPLLCPFYCRPVSKVGSVFPKGGCLQDHVKFCVHGIATSDVLESEFGYPHPKLSYLCLLWKNIY